MTRKCEKFDEKYLPYGSCKKKIGYFPNLGGGGGGVSDSCKIPTFLYFFLNPSLIGFHKKYFYYHTGL